MAKRKSKNQTVDPHKSDPRDRCQTPHYAVDPLLPFLRPSWRIWEPAAGDGQIVDALTLAGFGVCATDILGGQNFYTHEPAESWDALVTNPPYSSKYHWLEHCYRLGKPFALLVPVETLGAASAQRHMRRRGVECLFLNKRINFRMPNLGYDGGGANFPVFWLCWRLLPAPIVWGDIVPRADGQLSLLDDEATHLVEWNASIPLAAPEPGDDLPLLQAIQDAA